MGDVIWLAARRVAMPTLRVVAGRDMLGIASVADDEQVIIGRADNAQLRLTDQTVSYRHARVFSNGNDQITVIDLESTNGTRINGQSISRAVLRPGDHLEIAAVSLRLDVLSPDELDHLSRVVARQRAANLDLISGLWTRAQIPQLVEGWMLDDQPGACAFVDVDNFQSIDKKYGHEVADDVIRRIGRLRKRGERGDDVCVRYGDEEILMFLSETDELGAVDVVERIRCTIARYDWGRVAPGLQVTVSIGVAQSLQNEPIARWINRANDALLEAKRAGGNRVRAATMGEPDRTTPA